jgi:hypothetical protein
MMENKIIFEQIKLHEKLNDLNYSTSNDGIAKLQIWKLNSSLTQVYKMENVQ